MTDATPPTTSIEPKVVTPKADQDQLMLDDMIAIGQRLNLCLADAELSARLAARGYPAQRLQVGLDLQAVMQDKFNARTLAMSAIDEAVQALGQAEAEARSLFQELRDTARAIFKTQAEKRAMQLEGRVPDDRQKFMGMVLNVVKTARLQAYLEPLTEFGVTATKLTELEQSIDSLKLAENNHVIANTRGQRATEERNATYAELQTWHSQFAGIAKVATKDRPDLEARLNF